MAATRSTCAGGFGHRIAVTVAGSRQWFLIFSHGFHIRVFPESAAMAWLVTVGRCAAA